MSRYGNTETERLQKDLEKRMETLVQQLADLEECRDSFEDAEYEEAKAETLQEISDCKESLQRMISGDMTLVDRFGAIQLATQAAISAAHKTATVIRTFDKREPVQLRQRLCEIDLDLKLGKLCKDCSDRQRAEILTALRQLGCKLNSSELQLLEKLSLSNIDTTDYVQVTENTDKVQMAVARVGEEVRATQES